MHVCAYVCTVTVIEVLPKERRQKEEKTNILGQCSIDLFTILKGFCRVYLLKRHHNLYE